MPWSGSTFASRHNHSLHGAHADHAAKVANAILRRTGDEGLAIATANAREKHAGGGIVQRRDEGGAMIDPSAGTGIGGPTPVQTANPLAQDMVQRYSTYPTEKLAELSAQLGSTQQGRLIQQLLMQRRMSPPAQAPQQPQAQGIVAPQQQYKRGGTVKRDFGGGIGMGEAMPWWARREEEQASSPAGASGFLHGATPGRSDQVKTQAPPGSYVIPADVIAGLGEGNSLAGARIMQSILASGPYGTPLPRGSRGMGPPRPPRPATGEMKSGGSIPIFDPKGRAGGGANTGDTPVDLSDGEYVIGVDDVDRFGHGNRKRGHDFWDKWVVRKRTQHIAKLRSLPGPVKPRNVA